MIEISTTALELTLRVAGVAVATGIYEITAEAAPDGTITALTVHGEVAGESVRLTADVTHDAVGQMIWDAATTDEWMVDKVLTTIDRSRQRAPSMHP